MYIIYNFIRLGFFLLTVHVSCCYYYWFFDLTTFNILLINSFGCFMFLVNVFFGLKLNKVNNSVSTLLFNGFPPAVPPSRRRGIHLPATTVEEMKQKIILHEPGTLTSFLEKFEEYMHVIA